MPSLPSLTLVKWIRAIKPTWHQKQLRVHLETLHATDTTTLQQFFKQQPDDVAQLANVLQERLLLIKKVNVKSTRIFYDGRPFLDTEKPISIWLWRRNSLKNVKELKDLPTSSPCRGRSFTIAPLWRLVELNTPCPDPMWENLEEWFQKNKVDKVFCKLYYVTHFGYGCQYSVCHKTMYGLIGKPRIDIQAMAGPDYTIQYSIRQLSAREIAMNKKQKKIEKDWETTANTPLPEANKYVKNCSSAINVTLQCLTLARHLRVIQENEFFSLSLALAKTTMSIISQFDEQHHLRHITYQDQSRHFQMELPCFQDESKAISAQQKTANEAKAFNLMQTFFEKVWFYKKEWEMQRRNILQPLLSKLKSYPCNIRSLHRQCYNQLKTCIQKQLILVYSHDDESCSGLQYYFCRFIHSLNPKQRRAEVQLKLHQGHVLALVAKQVTIMNIQCYLEHNHDSHLYEEAWLEPALIKCHLKTLKRQAKWHGHYVESYCHQRGRVMGKKLLNVWLHFGEYIIQTFGIDIHSEASYKSLSYLAHQCIMTRLIDVAGVYEQGLEKTKAFYSDLLRLSSRGGFMFSSFSQLKAQEPIYLGGPSAQSISEYDLNSAYGYSASVGHLPSGFAVGYVKPSLRLISSSAHEGEEEKQVEAMWPMQEEILERIDTLRMNSFEFKATYYTLHQLNQQGFRVAYSWHNYSSMGIYFIGPYPLDLVVVNELGHLKAFQFDGIFAHGCDSCLPLKRYASDLSHVEIRQKTLDRDAFIQAWINQVSHATYQVITDCHDLRMATLNQAYKMCRELRALVDPYPTMSTLTCKSFLEWVQGNLENPHYTYLAWVQGRTHQPSFMIKRTMPPGDDLVNTTKSQPVLLVREYLEYLLQHQQLELTQLDAVIFYKSNSSLNQVYRELTLKRYLSTNATEQQFLKRVINFSIGFCGLKDNSGKVKHTLTDGIPQNYSVYKHAFNSDMPEMGFRAMGTSYLWLNLHRKPSAITKRKCSRSALPLFICIIEHTKMKLLHFLHYLAYYIHPQDWKLMYSQIDNVIVACSGRTLTETVPIDKRVEFATGWLQFVSEEKWPGLFKQEWICNDNTWQCISARIMNVVITSQQNKTIVRSSGRHLGNVEDSYKSACQMLQRTLDMLDGLKRQEPSCGS